MSAFYPNQSNGDRDMATVALVDDDNDIIGLVATALESEGYDVVAYPDGPAALNGLEKLQPDLAILDIRMPQMDGIELLRRRRHKAGMPVTLLDGRVGQTGEGVGPAICPDP